MLEKYYIDYLQINNDGDDKEIYSNFQRFKGVCDLSMCFFQYDRVEILDYSREYCKYILSSLQSNNGYEKIKKDTLSFLKALVEYLKDKKQNLVTNELEKLILQFAEDDIKRKMRSKLIKG